MSERRGIAKDLVEASRKEATGEVAKGAVRIARTAIFAIFCCVAASAWTLWSLNLPMTVLLIAASLLMGMAIGAAVGWRRACRARDAELAKITDRFDLNRFTAPQLDLMAVMYDVQNESGSMAIASTSQYEAMAKRLADEGMMTCVSDSGELGKWSLLPDWVRFVAGHRAEIDERSERARSYRQAEEELARHGKSKGYRLALPSVEQDRADCTLLRETFVHGIDPEQQAAVADAWLSPGRRLDVSKRPVRGLGEGIALSEFLVPDGDGWARATDGTVSLLDSSGDLVALVMRRRLEAEESPVHGDFARTLREMDFYTKSTLAAVWEHGSADVTWIDPDDPDPYDDMFSEIDETFLRVTNARLRDLELLGLVRFETVSGWDRRWTLEDGVADLLAEHADALDSAREDAGLTWERLTEIPGQGAPAEEADA